MSDKIFSHEAMMREIAARAELRLAAYRFAAPKSAPKDDGLPFSSAEAFDDFIRLWRKAYGVPPRVH